jgi:hypothetical protein
MSPVAVARGALAKFDQISVDSDDDGIGLQRRCDPGLWQVGMADQHFPVRRRPPSRFTLADVRAKPFPGCDRKLDMPGNIATLFPLEGHAP